MKKSQANYLLRFVLFLSGLLAATSNSAQISGSLFMNRNNFYAQIYNPSYFRADGAVAFSVAGFAGFSFVNQGNFEIADVITLNNANNPIVDIPNFYANSKANNLIRQDVTIPVLYFGTPLNTGYFHFYYNENVSIITAVKHEALAFLSNGNLPLKYRDFSSEEIRLSAIGYREFAVGYAKPLNNSINVGIRGKLLFGAAHIDTKNWEYGIETFTNGDSVALSAHGSGQLMLPVSLILDENYQIDGVDSKGAAFKYMGNFRNPGLAFDLGANYSKGKQHFFSAALRDLGAIWFRNNAYNLQQNEELKFTGFDLESGFAENGSPINAVIKAKSEIRDVYKPAAIENNYLRLLPLKWVLHYQYIHSTRHSFGATNQMAFQQRNIRSVLTLSAQQSWFNFLVFESLNLQGISGVTLGGGLQYETKFAQFFVAADNILATYHPAANKTFSLNLGVCFLLNHTATEKIEKGQQGGGRTSRYLPFYKIKK